MKFGLKKTISLIFLMIFSAHSQILPPSDLDRTNPNMQESLTRAILSLDQSRRILNEMEKSFRDYSGLNKKQMTYAAAAVSMATTQTIDTRYLRVTVGKDVKVSPYLRYDLRDGDNEAGIMVRLNF